MRLMSGEKAKPANSEWREGTLSHLLQQYTVGWYADSWKQAGRSDHIDYLVSRGMLYMRKLTSASFTTARRMVVTSALDAWGKFPMPDGLGSEVREKGEPAEGHPVKVDSYGCNFGWQWAVEQVKRTNAPANYELRDQGYVFWDKARLLEFVKFQTPRAPVKNVFEFPFGYQKHSDRPGVVEKLKNESIHSNIVREIEAEVQGKVSSPSRQSN